ncbi:heme NO-binding domain-containing protein [Acidocella facilis]|uniref:heme NO-binding domain-containing protein n=1 Tax=Acidocella facilis TaxID=525 RepID=UPI001F369344|nr:heme NO-binding domain-containing protein [Acidocella facilis]
MLGIIPHTVDGYIRANHSPQARAALLEKIGLPATQSFRLDTEYDDETCCRLIEALAQEAGMDREAVFDALAVFFLDWAETTFPGFFAAAPDTRGFLLIQPEIHASLACGLRAGAQQKINDKFRVVPLPDGVRVHYRSDNRLGVFYCALARRLAQRRGEVASFNIVEGDLSASETVIDVRLQPA